MGVPAFPAGPFCWARRLHGHVVIAAAIRVGLGWIPYPQGGGLGAPLWGIYVLYAHTEKYRTHFHSPFLYQRRKMQYYKSLGLGNTPTLTTLPLKVYLVYFIYTRTKPWLKSHSFVSLMSRLRRCEQTVDILNCGSYLMQINRNLPI